ncbi:LamG-like jellyroll fold domain-containing protein [Streptomyces laurentii]|uniref:LamG domain-containing protein n=1 Tax=Streptomyces laurentii TaxID=39478 RepID=UPI003676F4E4
MTAPSLLVLSAGTARAEGPAPALSESDQALQSAAESGHRVEVLGERTERETVFANPDGTSFTLEKSIVPVRVDTGDGWAKPDATLARREDGSIAPKAAVVDLSFSGGGSGASLVTIGQDGQSVSMGWPGKLPEPRLDGNRAVYEDVLPDVNLILTATVEGFRQVLEVETPQAAKLPELKSITYDLKADGLRLREGAVGSVEALDGNGQVVFRSPTARMWNSAGDSGTTVPAVGTAAQEVGRRALSGTAGAGVSGQEQADVPVGPAQEGDPLAGPGAGDKAAVMKADLAPESLTVTPDAGLIADTGTEDFPLYIDPSVELNESERTVLSSDGDVFYNFSGGDNGMSVGKCGSAVIGGVSYYCGNGYVNRMYFEFTPSMLKGKQVLDAKFRVTETWSFACTARVVDLRRTDPISSSSKWPGPASLDLMVDRSVAAGRGALCSPSQPRAVIEFKDNPGESNENLTPTVKSFADGKLSLLTLRLSAGDESDTVAWKRFDDDAVLSVTYMSKPAAPAEYGFPSGSTQVCSKSASAPTTITDPTPTLVATPRAAAGAETGAILRVYYDIDGQNPDGTWYDAPEPTTGSAAPTTGHLSYSATAKDFPNQSKDWNVALKEDGTLYRYAPYTYSFASTAYTTSLSIGSPYCYFKVDSKGPKMPVVASSSVYKQCVTGGACDPLGGPNQQGSFSFGSVSGETNTHYQYKLSTDAAWSGWKALTSGAFTVDVTPPTSGMFILNVQVKDGQNRVGEAAVKFLVKEGSGPVGRWDFNEASGVAVDRSTADTTLQDNLTLAGTGTSRTDHGRRGTLTAQDGTKTQDKALALNSTSLGAAWTAKPVVETQSPYTVTAWARLDEAGSKNLTVLGQDGSYHSPFYLSYCTEVKTWCVRMADKDAAGGALGTQRVNALQPPQLKAWTHLGLVVETKKIHFYVNGVLQGSDDLVAPLWSSPGGLQVGRVKYAGAYTDYFPGEIDEVAIWQRALSPEAIAIESRLSDPQDHAYAELVAQYSPAGAAGSSLTDNSGYGNALTLTSASLLDGETLNLDGIDDSGSTARPLVDDTGSFTVATAVDVDAKKLEDMEIGARLQVLGQQVGTTGSSWGIWFEKTGMADAEFDADTPPEIDEETGEIIFKKVPVGIWHFGRLASDGTGVSATSDGFLTPEGEVGLTGVYDSATKTVTLYVGSAAETAPRVYQATVGSGFTVGKAWNGSYLPGRISDIRLWAGALNNSKQVEDIVGY